MIKLGSLNEQQRDAVTHVDGPVVVVAGAGTGKTRTIAYRAAYLIERGIPAENILSITFTNKAAREMRSRISKIAGADACGRMTVSTIHSLCARILREDIDKLGRGTDYSIYDTKDQTSLIRKALIDNGFDPDKNDPRELLWRIGKLKNIYPVVQSDDFADPVFRCVYEAYHKQLEKNNALDFDDLLIFAARLFEKKSVLEKYQERFRYIMVDEYQDVNGCQYALIRRLAAKYKNLYVVGDDDQSIYGWRGAQVENILNFERDFKGAKVIKLERNYRSTAAILEAANELISKNEFRRAKKLWTSERHGDAPTLIEADDDNDEAGRIIDYIVAEKNRGCRFGDFGILFRTNAQSRKFEERLIRLGISYIIVGGTKFFERREIKDAASYLRSVSNPDDEESLMRIVNFPARGIGKTSLSRVRELAFANKLTLLEALRSAAGGGASVPAKTRDGIRDFVKIIDELKKHNEEKPYDPAGLMRLLVKRVDFKSAYEQACSDKNEAEQRYENIVEFVNAIAEYQHSERQPTLEGFLENIALMSDEKEVEEELREDSVTMMTLHSAKGLEFKIVFVAGVEEGYIPHELSEAEGFIEEERRLLYVGMTRARRRLFLSYSRERRRYGEAIPREQSRFIDEIPPNLILRESGEDYEKRREEAGRVIADNSRDRILDILGEK